MRENPDIADRIESGSLSSEQADVLASASDRTDGAAANDGELIDKLSGATPEQGRKIADDYVRDHTDPNDVQSAHDKARRIRNVRRYHTRTGTHRLILEGDRTSIDDIEGHINELSNILYQRDGGRDLPASKHRRTRDQRNFDAAHQLLTHTHNNTGPGAGNGSPVVDHDGDRGGAPGVKDRPRSAATIFVSLTVDQATGDSIAPVSRIGGGLLPPLVLDRLKCDSTWIGEIFSQNGDILWQGRGLRAATNAQWLALVARDQGCGQCGAHWSTCHAHHILPYEAPAQGDTDIDNLVLLCPSCHTSVHELEQTLYRNTAGQWVTRPAAPDEIAPRKPARPAKPKPTSGSGQRQPSKRKQSQRRSGKAPPDKPPGGDPPRSATTQQAKHTKRTKPTLTEQRRLC